MASCAVLSPLAERVKAHEDGGTGEAPAVAHGKTTHEANGAPASRKSTGGRNSGRNDEQAAKGAAGLTTLSADPDTASASVPVPETVDPEIRRIYAEGLAAQKSGRYDVALDNWERVWEAAPQYRDVADLLLKEYLVRGLEQFAAGSLDLAIGSWEKAQRIRPENPRVQAYLAKAREQRARTSPVE